MTTFYKYIICIYINQQSPYLIKFTLDYTFFLCNPKLPKLPIIAFEFDIVVLLDIVYFLPYANVFILFIDFTDSLFFLSPNILVFFYKNSIPILLSSKSITIFSSYGYYYLIFYFNSKNFDLYFFNFSRIFTSFAFKLSFFFFNISI